MLLYSKEFSEISFFYQEKNEFFVVIILCKTNKCIHTHTYYLELIFK